MNVASVNVARPFPLIVPQGGRAANHEVTALCFMALDDDVPTNALNALRSLSSLKVGYVRFVQLRALMSV